MSLFCLVHGSTQNASCWDFVIPELQRRGHETLRMNLPRRESEAGVVRFADVICEALAKHDDAIVVAHSVSGYFLPLVASRHPVRRMVFLAALVPKLGSSFQEEFRADPTILNAAWVGKDPTRDDKVAIEFLFHDVPRDLLSWALGSLSLMRADAALAEPYPLDRWPETPSSYIVCADDRTIQPEWSRRVAREWLGVEPIELPGGHCPHLSRPAALAEALQALGPVRK